MEQLLLSIQQTFSFLAVPPAWLSQTNDLLWLILIPLLVGVGILYTVRTGFVQIFQFGKAFKMIFHRYGTDHEDITAHGADTESHSNAKGDISHFAALMTALAATVGTGNIAGVATAIFLGGPGAVLWMWVTGLLGMATKYAEAVLGVHYRQQTASGEMIGGPMYYITIGLQEKFGINMRWLAALFCVFLAFAAIGIGNMVQSNSMASLTASSFGYAEGSDGYLTFVTLIGIGLAVAVGAVTLGGIKRIGAATSAIVPSMIALYVGAGAIILLLNIPEIPGVFVSIFEHAFGYEAVGGAAAGITMKMVIQQGFSRGVFSNESGLGSSPIAAAAAKTKHPVDQALVSMTQTFIDTIVVCTFTALIIILSGIWTGDGALNGAPLTGAAFGAGLGGLSIAGMKLGSLVVSICLFFFAFSTILGWSYYGERGLIFIFGEKAVLPFRVFYVVAIVLGTFMSIGMAWKVAELCTALMAYPNIVALLFLSGKVRQLTIDYFRHEKDGKGYAVEPFHQKT